MAKDCDKKSEEEESEERAVEANWCGRYRGLMRTTSGSWAMQVGCGRRGKAAQTQDSHHRVPGLSSKEWAASLLLVGSAIAESGKVSSCLELGGHGDRDVKGMGQTTREMGTHCDGCWERPAEPPCD